MSDNEKLEKWLSEHDEEYLDIESILKDLEDESE